MPLILKDAEDTMELGRMLAEALRGSSVRALYLYADLGGGKTTLTRGLVSALPGGENAEVASPSFTLCNIYPTRPEVLHADLYRLSEGASMPEEMEEMLEDGNALLVLEWPEYLASQYHAAERLEVHLAHAMHEAGKSEEKHEHVTALKTLDNADKSCKSFRLATLEAHGAAATALLDMLMPRLERRFMPEQA
ncbi:MAG: tRNA (adenosine(37)-N6)-threonylcarbamoyltransferase complex ATPase subunit type 1 TsaE [Mailhella sp.]|nr:tRNA (adenosine(37)-N6)-threonylcarbamoyltransferase complex ATPase subunit type 1 TsaE [Mailhella sp.]